MNNKLLWGVIVLIILVAGGVYFYQKNEQTQAVDPNAATADLGMYPYVCDNGSTFNLSPLEGLKTVQVSADAQGMFTGTATLSQVANTSYSGTAPDGQSVALLGDGETIYLTVGSEQATCNPVPNSTSAPWNWGDAGTTTTGQ